MLALRQLGASAAPPGLNRLSARWKGLCGRAPSLPLPDDMDPTRNQNWNQNRSRNQIQKVLCVAEKNDAAKGIAEIMSGGAARRREGLSKFNKIYEYNYHLFGQNVSVTMTSVSGHLLGCEFKAPYQKWHSCNPVLLFDAEVEKYCPDNMLQIKRTLEKEVRSCQALVIWTDCDREGENIGFEIIDVCRAVKPSLQVFRAKFSEITSSSVSRACQTLAEPNANVSDAVDVRQELDLRIGASFTRFQTLRLQRVFPAALSNQLVSYGSCQFPTLGFVVERFKSIQSFIPETFYKIRVVHEVDDQRVEFSWKRNRLFNHTCCLVLYQICMEDPTATVTAVTSKPKSKWRPLPLDTVELEKLSSRKLKISAKETMKIAEKLYTQGLISYPRTETNIFPESLSLVPLVQQQSSSPDWGSFAQRVLDQPGGPNPRRGAKSDQAHPPIHPTKYCASLQGNEQRVYEFIVRHFLACVSQDAVGQETAVEVEIGGERFSASGLMILARNYLDVYPYDRWSDKVIPVYESGSRFQPSAVEMMEGETSPPQLLTEADLIALMERHGIGTDATHAEHIETIKSRMYVGLTADQRFTPGELGMGLVEGYNSMGYQMSKPTLRAELEEDLKLVSEGRKDKAAVLQRHILQYKTVFIESVRKAKRLDEALSPYLGAALDVPEPQEAELPLPVRKCPHCGRDMVLRKRKDGNSRFLSCVGFPSCKTALWFPDVVLEVSRDEAVCDTCRPHPVHLLKMRFRRGALPPMMPLEFVGCVGGCDETLREVLDLKYLRPPAGGGAQEPRPPVAAAATSNPRQLSRPPVPSSWAPPPGPGGGGADEGVVVCNCGQEALLLTVRKEGANQGRRFYKCNAGTCSFFLWADQSSQDPPTPYQAPPRASLAPPRASLASRNTTGQGAGPVDQGAGPVVCQCGEEAVTRTVTKDGNNKGRTFYTCRKSRETQCGFFQWTNENTPPGGGANQGGGVNQGGGANGGGGRKKPRSEGSAPKPPGTRKPRTCGLCHLPGHTRLTCPQR